MNIVEVDSLISDQVSVIKSIATKLNFEEICQFQLGKAEGVIPWNSLKHQGVYLFEVNSVGNFDTLQTWLDDFRNRWHDETYKPKFTPNFKKKRMERHSDLKDWMPLYIGISKNIGDRVRTHIFKELDKPTFAMKLNARKNMHEEWFRLSKIKFDVVNYDVIMPVIESVLRDRINPLIGKQ